MDRRFHVECSECTFERDVHGKEDAERLALSHSTRTDHEVLALELPARPASD